jgi:hypothetical protein
MQQQQQQQQQPQQQQDVTRHAQVDSQLERSDTGQEQQQNDAQPGHLVQRAPGNRVHFCVACHSPIAIYGRLLPCWHTFCLACATDMPKCHM